MEKSKCNLRRWLCVHLSLSFICRWLFSAFLSIVLDGDVASRNVLNVVVYFFGERPQMCPKLKTPNLFTCTVMLSLSLLFFSCSAFKPFLPGPHGFQERLAASQEAMKNKNVVNLGAIRQGMKRFQFLLNCCEPGTIPDASILAAALDLVRYSRFRFLTSSSVTVSSSTLPVLTGSSGGGAGLAFPRVRAIRPPMQPRQLAGVDEGPPREYHQERPVQGPLAHRGQQKEPEASVERRQTFLPVGRRELKIP